MCVYVYISVYSIYIYIEDISTHIQLLRISVHDMSKCGHNTRFLWTPFPGLRRSSRCLAHAVAGAAHCRRCHEAPELAGFEAAGLHRAEGVPDAIPEGPVARNYLDKGLLWPRMAVGTS